VAELFPRPCGLVVGVSVSCIHKHTLHRTSYKILLIYNKNNNYVYTSLGPGYMHIQHLYKRAKGEFRPRLSSIRMQWYGRAWCRVGLHTMGGAGPTTLLHIGFCRAADKPWGCSTRRTPCKTNIRSHVTAPVVRWHRCNKACAHGTYSDAPQRAMKSTVCTTE